MSYEEKMKKLEKELEKAKKERKLKTMQAKVKKLRGERKGVKWLRKAGKTVKEVAKKMPASKEGPFGQPSGFGGGMDNPFEPPRAPKRKGRRPRNPYEGFGW